MKIIITENQYKMLLESNFESMQSLIDMAFEDLKEDCENYYLNSYTCEEVEVIEKIKVVDVQKVFVKTQTTKEDSFLLIKIDVDYNYIREYKDLSDFEIQLQWKTKQIIGNNIRVLINNQNNTRKNESENNDRIEINERCWKGYTQKGMKTMFGKRYPNCVKVK